MFIWILPVDMRSTQEKINSGQDCFGRRITEITRALAGVTVLMENTARGRETNLSPACVFTKSLNYYFPEFTM